MPEKMKLIESFSLEPTFYKEKTNLKEEERTFYIQEKEGKKTKFKAKAIYTFPISRPDQENLNKRIYSSKLWENVIKKKMGENTYGLMDHPKEEGSTKDRWCVWRNLRFSEDKKLILADAYLIGHWGQEVLESLEAGGAIGLSSSGLGEFKEDKKTVEESSFELERVADFVFDPSYEVFGTQDDLVESLSLPEKKEESLIEKTEEIEDIQEKELKEKEKKTMENTKRISSFEEKSFRLNILASFKEAKKIESIKERIASYTELLSYFEEDVAEELRKEIEVALQEEKANFEELAKKGETIPVLEEEKSSLEEELTKFKEDLEKVNEELTSIKEDYTNATELLDSLKAYTTKLKEMYDISLAEKNGMVTATEYKEALVYIDSIEEEKVLLEKEIITLRQELREEKETKSKTAAAVVTDDDEEDDEEEEKEEKKDKKKESFIGVPKEISNYYTDLEFSNPSVIQIKEDILRCRTLMEAQRTYLRLRGLITENYSPYDRREIREKVTVEKLPSKKLKSRKGWI
jgi:hypothetical protein